MCSRKCPVCGIDKKSIIKYNCQSTLKSNISRQIGYPETYNIACCDKCGFVYLDMNLTDESIDRYYSEYNMYDDSSSVKTEVYDNAVKMYLEIIEAFIDKKCSIVDVGCGSGKLIRTMHKQGYLNVSGIDPSEYSINAMREQGVSCQLGSAYNCSSIAEPVDAVLLVGVLEHLLRPRDAVCEIKNILKPNGLFFVAVPNLETFAQEKFPEANCINHEHINFFDKYSLDNLLRSEGFVRISDDEYCYKKMSPELDTCLMGIYQLGEEIKTVGCTENSCRFMKEYVAFCDDIENRERAIIEEVLKEDTIIVWGCGNYASSLLKRYPKLLDKVEFFVDNSRMKQMTGFEGKAVYDKAEILKNPQKLILGCVMLNKESIEKELRDIGAKNKLIYANS